MEKARPREGYEVRDNGRSPEERQGNGRTASERPQVRQQYSNSSRNTRSDNRPPQQRRRSDEEEDAYPDELYDMYRNSRGSKSNGQSRRQPRYEEEEEYASDYEGDDFDDGDFEIMNSRPPARSRATSSSGGGRGQSKKPDVRKIRVKVHAEDVRYIMIGSAIEFADLVDRIREKFGLRKRFKIQVRDEDVPNGDMITMGDQDDLDMVLMGVKSQAKRERLDMGKMEVCLLPRKWKQNENER
jgi:hypothetical protein